MSSILDKELGLILTLREISYDNSRANFQRQFLNKCKNNCVIIRAFKTAFLDKLTEFK
jgi:hypothetical protein